MKKIIHKLRYRIARFRTRISGYYPFFPIFNKYDLFNEISNSLSIPQNEVIQNWKEYGLLIDSLDYEKRYGGQWELKHLSTQEAFIIFCLLKKSHPASIVEIGTQFGVSTRRIIDMKENLNIKAPVYAFDIENQVKYFSSNEAQLRIADLTDNFKEEVLDVLPPGLIYIDAHPYSLLKNVFEQTIKDKRWIVAIHDCGMGLYNPKMALRRSDNDMLTSTTGMWERYVLAEIFNVKNPGDPKLDNIESLGYKLRIFSTPHGLGLLMPIK